MDRLAEVNRRLMIAPHPPVPNQPPATPYMLISTSDHHLFRANFYQLPGLGNGVRLRDFCFCDNKVQMPKNFLQKIVSVFGGRQLWRTATICSKTSSDPCILDLCLTQTALGGLLPSIPRSCKCLIFGI